MYKKMIGSILMILGTSIGAGMLALPVVAAQENYLMSLILLFSSWILMTLGAFSLLEVNLWLAPNTNLISMAQVTLGKYGKIMTWIIYLLLLYSLICAYLSGISDILQSLLANIHINIPRWSATLLGLILFGLIVYNGISSVDIVNRGLMGFKLLAYLLLIACIFQHIDLSNLWQGDYQWRHNTFMVMMTSFGFAIIVPSLRTYLESNVRLLKRAVFIGSLLPLIIYALWILVIQGLIPRNGTNGLIATLGSANTNSMLLHSISTQLNTAWLVGLAKAFISISAITSFLGVSVCLTDFIADGLKIDKRGRPGLSVYGISYLPPLFIVLIAPGIFVSALAYAGILCVLLLIIIPLMMLYAGRYKHNFLNHLTVPGGKVLIGSALAIGFLILVANIQQI